MIFSRRDRVALPISCVAGAGFGYLAVQAGIGGVIVGGFYSLLVIPLIVRFVAEQRKLLIWQVCILAFVFSCIAQTFSIPGSSMADALGEFCLLWISGVVLSFPVPAYYYFQRAKKRKSYRVEVFLCGLLYLGFLSRLPIDVFLIFALGALWIIASLGKIIWDRRLTANPSHDRGLSIIVGSAAIFACAFVVVGLVFFKQNALGAAIYERDSKVAALLLEMRADPNARDARGNTPLADAAWNGDALMVRVLLEKGADPNEQQKGAFQGLMPSGTALAVAASAGRTEICEALMDAGADVNAQNAYGQTPLVAGLAHGDISCALMLIEHGADVNSRGGLGETPLMFLMPFDTDNDPAAHRVLEALLSRGADISAKDDKGQTAEDLALQYRRFKTEQQLQQIRQSASEK